MAALAAPSKLPKMQIICRVAGKTCRGRLSNTFALWTRVTSVASQGLVSAVQRVTGGHSMVKLPDAPLVWCMATGTICAEAAVVLVIVFVTRHTGDRRVFKCLGLMTAVTRGFLMLAKQGERAQRVIKYNGRVPALFRVTIFAVLAFLAQVRIIVAMTCMAIFRHIHGVSRLCVTGLTLRCAVLATQGKPEPAKAQKS